MKRMSILVAIFTLLSFALGDVSGVIANDDESSTLAIQQQWRGSQCGVEAAGQRVITNSDDWSALWKSLHARRSPQPPVPEIDFEKSMVLAAFMGTQRSGGYAIEITSVEQFKDGVVVNVQTRTPPPGAITLSVITYPFHVVAIPKYEGEATWKLSAYKPPKPAPGAATTVIVGLKKGADLDTVAKSLEKSGLTVVRKLTAIKMIIGKIPRDKMKSLQQVEGVKFVEEDKAAGF